MTFRFSNINQKGSMLIIALVVAAIIVAGGAAAYVATDGFGGNKDDSDNQAATSQQKDTDQDKTTTTSSAKTLFAGAKAGDYDVKCTFDDGTHTGTVYVSGDTKMRFDTQTPENGMGHVLRLDKTVYTWTEGQSAGTKLTLTDTSSDAATRYSADKYVDDADKYNLECENAGRLDASVFAVPSGVTFKDLSQYLN